jgi:hypothetical protein
MYKLINITNLKSLYKIINYYPIINNKQILDFNKTILTNYFYNNSNDWKLYLDNNLSNSNEFKKINISFTDINRVQADLNLLYYPPNYKSLIISHHNKINLSLVLDGALIYNEYKDGLSNKKIFSQLIQPGFIKTSTNNFCFHNYNSFISNSSIILSIDCDKVSKRQKYNNCNSFNNYEYYNL